MGVDRWSYTWDRINMTMRKIRLLLLAMCLLQYLESPTSGKMYLVETKEKDNGYNKYQPVPTSSNQFQPVLADSTSTKEMEPTTSGEPMLNSEEQAIQNQDLPLLQQPPRIFGRGMLTKFKKKSGT